MVRPFANISCSTMHDQCIESEMVRSGSHFDHKHVCWPALQPDMCRPEVFCIGQLHHSEPSQTDSQCVRCCSAQVAHMKLVHACRAMHLGEGLGESTLR